MLGIFDDIVNSLDIKIVPKWFRLVEIAWIAGTKNSGGLLSQHPSESSDGESVVRYLRSSTVLTQATHDAILPEQIQRMFVYQVKDDGLATLKLKDFVRIACIAVNVKQ